MENQRHTKHIQMIFKAQIGQLGFSWLMPEEVSPFALGFDYQTAFLCRCQPLLPQLPFRWENTKNVSSPRKAPTPGNSS